MKRRLLFAALAFLPMLAFSQAAPQHEQYVKIGLGETAWGNAYSAWVPGQAFYKGLDAEAEENENFNISRIKPRQRFTNAQTQVRPTQDSQRKLLWWCPIGGDGWNALPSYFFGGEVWTMWSYTDIWGNWTAPLMSMPATMLDVCHKNGVKISCLAPVAWAAYISTTDGTGYGYLLRKLLTDAGGADKFLKFLKYYGIDGMGFNSEFTWSGTLSGGPYSGQAFHTGMKNFLGDCYTKADSYGVPFHNCWYSLTNNSGSLGGSSALDGSNKDWFHYNGKPTSTVYFTNYGASLSTSQNTVEVNFPTRSSFDVHMGVDYQAGGAVGNWTSLSNYNISIGIWGAHNRNLIYETRGERGSDPLQQQKTYQMILENVFTGSTKNPVNPPLISTTTRFNSMSTNAYGWAQFITARSTLMCQDGGDLSTDPFVTNFNLGNGNFFNIKGERHADTEWYNIGMQDYMPTWRWWATTTYMGRTEAEVSDDLKYEFTWDDAWFGGSCMQISGATDKTYLQLFKTKYETAKSGDYLTIRYKVLSGSGTLTWAVSKEGAETTVIEKAIKSGASASDEWVTVNTAIGGRSGLKIESSVMAQLGLKFTNTSDDFKVLIGQIALTRGKPGTYTQPATPKIEKSKMMARNYKGVDMKIIFNMDDAYSGPAKEAYEPVYNADVNTSYFRIYTQQEGKEEKVFTATTSWAAYVVAAPYVTEDAGKMRIGVSAVGLDYESESAIAWGEWMEPMTIEPTIVEGTEIDKPIIKAGEEFTLKYIDVNHPAATWEIINSMTGASVQTFNNTKSITMSLSDEGSYDIKITNADGTVAYTRGIIQVSPAETGAIPQLGTLTADKQQAEVDENITLSYTTARLGEGAVSRSIKVEDPNLLRFPEVVGSRPYTYMMWFKVDKFTHGSEGTNLIDKRSFSDVWPHNNWGDIWVTIRSYPQDGGAYPRYETGASSTSQTSPHPANEISFNTYGWTEHDAPNANMMSNDHSVNEGQWTHLAVTFGTDNVQKMYFNGKKVAETTIQHITSNGVRSSGSSVYIGGTSVYKGGFNGWVDEFQVWDRVLTDAEVQTAMKGYTTAPSGLQGYWTFEETVKDANGNNVFPNKGTKGSSYNAALISTVGQKGENTSEVVQTVINASNDELGNPMISGSYQVTTSAEWSAPGATLSETTNGAVVSYDATGTYTAGLTLKNMWGSDKKTIDFVIVSAPDGIEDAVVEEMGVYPNPFTDFVNLCFANEGAYTIEIVALDGKLIESKQINVSANEGVRLDINGEKGMYIIKVLNANNAAVRTLKVIKK
ncbi:MAG: T9SS type A sorting domain-containing protein [Bacteroidales bacterium]|nr:T9SS type A sorting domain-containing protein [Bacteroidales bacterium]